MSEIPTSSHKSSETLSEPSFLPIFIDEKKYWGDGPDPKEGILTQYQGDFDGRTSRSGFLFQKTIDGLRYKITLFQDPGENTYNLSFETLEYEYATTNLSETGKEQLLENISLFVKSAAQHTPITTIRFSPAPASYSSEEIEDCYAKILTSPQNSLSEASLRERYKGFEVFDYYAELFDHDFHSKHYNSTSRRRGRGRLFRTMISKAFPDWVAYCDPFGDYTLTRKNPDADSKK